RLKADSTVIVNQILTIFLIESSIHILEKNRYPVDTRLIHLESRKSPTKSLFNLGSRRISIVTVKTKEYHSDVLYQSQVERTEAKQLKIVLRRSRQETHISQHGGSSIDEGTGSKPGVLDVPSDDSEEEISWNSSDDEDVDDQDKGRHDDEGEKNDESDADDDYQDDAEKDDDDDEEEIAKLDKQEDTESGEGDVEETESDEESVEEETKEEEEEEEEESFDPIPRTPEDSEDDGNGEEDQGLRVSEEQRLIKEEEVDELYRDIDINQGRGLQVSQDIIDSHVTLTPVKPDGQQESSSVSSFITSMLNPISDAGVESIFTTALSPIAPLQTSTPIMTPSTIATITTSSETPIPPITIPSAVLQNLPTFDSTNQFAEAVSKISGQVKSQVKEQVSRILPRIEESVNAQLEAEVLTRSFHSSRTSYAVAADLTEMELKKILIEKMEGNKEGGEPESVSTPSEPATRSASRSTTGTQSRQMSASESTFAEEPVQTTCQIDEPTHSVFETGAKDQPIVQTSQHPEWFSQPRKPPTPDCDWNKTLPAIRGSAQTWISEVAKQADSRSSFNELLDTPIDFSNFIMNQLGVDTLTPELLAGPTYKLMRGSCTSLTELEYHLEEVYKAIKDQLDWVNPEGQQYPHNLLQPLPLIPDNRGRRVIPFAHFINNDLEYLRGGASSQKYTTSVTKTKAADYGHIKWIKDLVPHTMWIQEPLNYDKHALWGVSHWGWKHQQFYGFAVNRKSALDVYSKRRIIADVYKEYCHPSVCGRSSIGSRKLPEEAQPNQARHASIRSNATDGTLNDVRNALDDRIKGIRMQYLPQTIWRKGDKDRAAAMIQSIDKMLKPWRIMRSLERFVGGRLYKGEF
nr:hypothetical protein [Tanacetum cinerariifolium]